MDWIEFEQPSGKKIPRWKRTLGFDKSTGEVFVPAAIAGNEQNVLLCALYDGTRAAEFHKHMYFPANWVAKEFPKTAEICNAMIEAARKSIDSESS